MEGKEARFGIANSALFATVTTDASCGAVNAMHDSFTPIGGMVPLVNMMLGEVIFGGVGAGHVRHPDLRRAGGVHRRPDGRPHARVPRQEDRGLRRADGDAGRAGVPARRSWCSPASRRCRRTSARRASRIPARTACRRSSTPTPRAPANNGSAFAGISANTKWYNTTLGIAMLIGRFMIIIPMLALAGNLGRKKQVPPSLGTFPVTTPLFADAARRRDRDRRRADVLPGAQPRPDRRALPDARGHDVLTARHVLDGKDTETEHLGSGAGAQRPSSTPCASSIRG